MSDFLAEAPAEPNTSKSDDSTSDTSDWVWQADYAAQGDDAIGPETPALTEAWSEESVKQEPLPDLADEPPNHWVEGEVVDIQVDDTATDRVEDSISADEWDEEELASEQPAADTEDATAADELTTLVEVEAKPTDELHDEHNDLATEQIVDQPTDPTQNPASADDWNEEEPATEQPRPDLLDDPQSDMPGQSMSEPTSAIDVAPDAAHDGSTSTEAFDDIQSTTDIGNWLGDVNPNHTGEFDDPYSENCGKCAESVFNQFEGAPDLVTADVGTYQTAEMQDATGVEQVPMSPSEIEQALIDGGPGSHAVIGVDWEDGGGHWYNAYYDGDKVWAVDGQTGDVRPWPGVDPATVKNWDAGIKTR